VSLVGSWPAAARKWGIVDGGAGIWHGTDGKIAKKGNLWFQILRLEFPADGGFNVFLGRVGGYFDLDFSGSRSSIDGPVKKAT
jgi:hypothetical protein